MTASVDKPQKEAADDEDSQRLDKIKDPELDQSSYEALKLISDLGSSVGFDQTLNGNSLTANIEQIRTKKNISFFEQLGNIKDELKQLSDIVDQMNKHVLELKTVSKTSI